MILIDSTVWIDYFNGVRTPQSDKLDTLIGKQDLLVGDLIITEVLQGFRDDRDFDLARKSLLSFNPVPLLSLERAVRCAQYYQTLRTMGITVRKTIDCWIATFCIETRTDLLHADRDFDPFEQHLGLSVIHC